jgi:hypothetical protein
MRLQWFRTLLLFIAFATACDVNHYDAADLLGKYKLTYDDGRIEYLTLLSDHRFIQQFEHQEHTGHWEYVVQGHRAHLFLDRQEIFVGTWAMPRGLLHGDLVVQTSADGPRLVFNDDLGWVFVRMA